MAIIVDIAVSAVDQYADRKEEISEALMELSEKPVSVEDIYADKKFFKDYEGLLSEVEMLKFRLAEAEQHIKRGKQYMKKY